GVAVMSSTGNVARQVEWLLRNGAGEIMVRPAHVAAPRRVLIHWADDVVRRSTLAVAASLLRHVPAEAVYLGILPSHSDESQKPIGVRSEEHTSELQSRENLVCRLLLEKKKRE